MTTILKCPVCAVGPDITRTESAGDAEKRYEFYTIEHPVAPECFASTSFNTQLDLEFNSLIGAILWWNAVMSLNQYTVGE
jgi:hypothetical protein